MVVYPDPRRRFLLKSSFALSAALFTTPGLFADVLTQTPKQTEGPFYPDKLPLDTDNDLILINEKITPAVGTITHLTGKVMDLKGTPVRNAVVEIWQCDANGAYLHSGSDNRRMSDKNFQGYGRFLTGSTGEYYFRTIKPVPYPGRTPHIHFKIRKGAQHLLTTQCYIKGDKGNPRDGILQSIRDPKAKGAVLVDFSPMKGSKIGELVANFDIVLGMTPKG